MMACMNSGGKPGTWIGAVVPLENRDKESSDEILLAMLTN